MTDALLQTPFVERHRSLGARLVPFAGWEMPVQYEGIIAEHKRVRTSAGLFDIAHMGVVAFAGPGALRSVQWLTTNDASKLAVGRAQYSLLCREDGGILDDVIVYRTAEDELLMVVNASNRDKDVAWMQAHVPDGGAAPEPRPGTALLALQGPAAAATLAGLTDLDVDALPYFGVATTEVAGVGVHVARTGYTGEDGFELFVPADGALALWDAVLEAGAPAGVAPCGLGARDTLRLEMAYPLYGNELDESTSPLEAGLRWVVKLKKGDFLGREGIVARKERGQDRKLVGIRMEGRGIPRHGYAVLEGDRPVGEVTSGTSSPTLQAPIGLAYVPTGLATTDTSIAIDIRGRAVAARVTPTPFVEARTKR